MSLIALLKTFRETGRFSVKIVKQCTRKQSGMTGGGSEIPSDPYKPHKTKDQPKSWVFTPAGLKRHYELTPLVFCVVVVLAMINFTVMRAVNKNDVIFNKSKELPPWERVDLEKKKINKAFSHQKFEGLPELKKLKSEINEGMKGNGNGNGNGAKGKRK